MRGYNEIHNIKKHSEALPSQVFQVVAKSNQRAKAGKGHILFSDQTTKDTLEARRAEYTLYTPDPTVRKHLGNNLARNYPAGMPQFLISTNFLFQIFNAIGQVLLQFQNFYVPSYIRFLSLV